MMNLDLNLDLKLTMNFEDLDVWQRSRQLSAKIFQQLKNCGDFNFRDQITRAGLSIPSNVAEGFERESTKDCINFLSYAKGSCGEVRTQIYIGMDIGYIPKETAEKWIIETQEISAMLGGLIKTKRSFLK